MTITIPQPDIAVEATIPSPDVDENKALFPLEGFTRVTDQIYVQPPPETADQDTLDPSTVVLFGWGDALPKHVAKYVEGYRALFPSARLVLVFSPILRALLSGLDARTRNMAPALDAIFGPAGTAPPAANPPRILIQVMSNTGGINYAATLNAHVARHAGATLPHALLVLDSTPGSTDFFSNIGRWSRALALGAGRLPIPFAVAQTVAAGFLSAISLAAWLVGRVSAADFSVGAVNNPSLTSKTVRRLYLYSKADDIIHWEDIEAHAAVARAEGYMVDAEMFEGTQHVGHMRAHPQQYWDAIARSWSEVVKAEKER